MSNPTANERFDVEDAPTGSLVRVPVLVGAWIGSLAYLVYSAKLLPDHVASHFNFAGQPDQWSSREFYLIGMGLVSLGVPLLLLGIPRTMSRLPARYINVPHREYWLAPERLSATVSTIGHYLQWYVCLLLVFLTGIQVLVVIANQSVPVALPNSAMFAMLGGFLLGTVIWLWRLLRHFGTVPA